VDCCKKHRDVIKLTPTKKQRTFQSNLQDRDGDHGEGEEMYIVSDFMNFDGQLSPAGPKGTPVNHREE